MFFTAVWWQTLTFVLLDLEIIMIRRKWKLIKYIKMQLLCNFEKDRSICHQILYRQKWCFSRLAFFTAISWQALNMFVLLDFELIILCKFQKDWSILHQIIDKIDKNDVFLDFEWIFWMKSIILCLIKNEKCINFCVIFADFCQSPAQRIY